MKSLTVREICSESCKQLDVVAVSHIVCECKCHRPPYA